MRTFRGAHRLMAFFLALTASIGTAPSGPVHAEPDRTEAVGAQSAADGDRAKLKKFLARDDVRQQLEAVGLDPDETTAHAAKLPDDDVRQISARIEEPPTGQGAVTVVVAAAAIVALVLILTDMLALTNIFPFIKPQRTR